MSAEILVVGHGICGSWLGYSLERAGISFEVIDQPQPSSASWIASGVINPVTGRRLVKTWLIDILLPYCMEVYSAAGKVTGKKLIEELPLIDFHSGLQRRNAFWERTKEDDHYLFTPADTSEWSNHFTSEWGWGIIKKCLLAQMRTFMAGRKEILRSKNQLREETFEDNSLRTVNHRIEYKGERFEKIIYCDGAQGFAHPFFSSLPFAACKGEALWLEIPDLPTDHIYKKGITLVPWEKNIFWAGSNYEWSFQQTGPTAQFRERTVALLKQWLRIPFRVINHQAAVRPATRERRPFVGFHPAYPQIGILNGMGTKGCSLAPYFAQALTEYLKKGTPIHPEADIVRFRETLGAIDE